MVCQDHRTSDSKPSHTQHALTVCKTLWQTEQFTLDQARHPTPSLFPFNGHMKASTHTGFCAGICVGAHQPRGARPPRAAPPALPRDAGSVASPHAPLQRSRAAPLVRAPACAAPARHARPRQRRCAACRALPDAAARLRCWVGRQGPAGPRAGAALRAGPPACQERSMWPLWCCMPHEGAAQRHLARTSALPAAPAATAAAHELQPSPG